MYARRNEHNRNNLFVYMYYVYNANVCLYVCVSVCECVYVCICDNL